MVHYGVMKNTKRGTGKAKEKIKENENRQITANSWVRSSLVDISTVNHITGRKDQRLAPSIEMTQLTVHFQNLLTCPGM